MVFLFFLESLVPSLFFSYTHLCIICIHSLKIIDVLLFFTQHVRIAKASYFLFIKVLLYVLCIIIGLGFMKIRV